MSGPNLPEIPAPLKGIQHYLKIATEHDKRDPVVSYWARLYSLQTSLKISTKTSAENNFLLKLMDWLEATKKSLIDNEAITNEVAAQAHLENWALKLFLYADKNDREGNFNKSVVQSFYTAGLLYDVLTTFGELTDEAVQNRKYAKWKAAYIHNCLKNGETPVPGPMKDEREDDDNSNVDVGPGSDEDLLLDTRCDEEPADDGTEKPEVASGEVDEVSAAPEEDEGKTEPDVVAEENRADEPPAEPDSETPEVEQAEEVSPETSVDSASLDEDMEALNEPSPPPSNNDPYGLPSVPGGATSQEGGSTRDPTLPTSVNPNPYNPATTPTSPGVSAASSTALQLTEDVTLSPEQINKAAKYIKWAGVALHIEVATAIENLQRALDILTTGVDA